MPDAERPSVDPNAKARSDFKESYLKPYVDWYWRNLDKIYRKYIACYWIDLIAGLTATILAAAPKFSHGDSIVRWLVVAASAVGTFVTGTLTPRYKRMLEDRDQGRIKLDALSARLAVEDYPASLHTEFNQIIDEIAKVEWEDGRLDRAPDVKTKGK